MCKYSLKTLFIFLSLVDYLQFYMWGIKMKRIPLVFICDANYAMPTAVVMTSVVANKNADTHYEFIILGTGLNEDIKNKLMAAAGGETVRIIDFDVQKYQNMMSKTHVSVAALCKFEIADILKDYDKVLYLDGDIIVQDDLRALYETDIDGFYAAAVKDAYVLQERKDGFKLEGYFNSGVMLLNCKKMREDNMAEKLWELKLAHRDLLFMDQDVFNLAFCNKVRYLDLRYNFMASYFRLKYRSFLEGVYQDADYVRAQCAKPAIIHYTGKNPWQYYHRIGAQIWRRYYKLSPFGRKKLHYKDRLGTKLRKLLPVCKEQENGKVEVFWGKKRLFAYWNRQSKFQQLYAKRFSDELSTEDKEYLLSVLLGRVVDYKPDLKNPQTLSEKLQWLKLHYHQPLLTQCADKYAVREYVAEKIGEQYLIPLLGVWDKPEDIDFEALPDQFVLKVNWGSGQNIIVKDKSKLNKSEVLKKLKKWTRREQNHYYYGFEWAYKDIQPKIIAEKYIEQLDGQVFDYKFKCFNGEPAAVLLCKDRGEKVVYEDYDLDWQPCQFEAMSTKGNSAKPENLQEMVALAAKLSVGFPFVRVDFYNIDGQIFFGELTFYPGCGYNSYFYEWDMKFGQMIKLPKPVQ